MPDPEQSTDAHTVAGLTIRWPQGREGLTPFSGTNHPMGSLSQPEPDGRQNLADSPRVHGFLGVSRSTLMPLIKSRKIDAIRMDGGWRFRWEDVERFVQRGTRKAV